MDCDRNSEEKVALAVHNLLEDHVIKESSVGEPERC